MWEKNHSCPAHGAAAVSPQGNAQTMKMAFQGHISVFSGTPGKCALWIYYVCITHYLATCKCGIPLISSHTCVVMWEALPQSLSSVSNLGCLHMSKPLFVLHGSSLVLRKRRKESYVQKEQLWWTDHILWVHIWVSTKKHTWSRWSLYIQGQTQMAGSLQPVHWWGIHFVQVAQWATPGCSWVGRMDAAPGERLWPCTNPSHNKGHRELWQESFLNTINQFISQHINP